MAMVGVDSGSLYRRTHSLSLVLGRRPLGAVLHSSNELVELSQWLCHDDSTINIVLELLLLLLLLLTPLLIVNHVTFWWSAMGLDVHLGQLVVCHGSRRSSRSAGGLPWVSTFIWVGWWSAMGIDVHLGQLVDFYGSTALPWETTAPVFHVR